MHFVDLPVIAPVRSTKCTPEEHNVDLTSSRVREVDEMHTGDEAIATLARPQHGAIHISVTGPTPRPRAGLAIHRSHSLNAAVHDGLPLTGDDLAVLLQTQMSRTTVS